MLTSFVVDWNVTGSAARSHVLDFKLEMKEIITYRKGEISCSVFRTGSTTNLLTWTLAEIIRPPFSWNEVPHDSPKYITLDILARRAVRVTYLRHCDRWFRSPNGWICRRYHSFHPEYCRTLWHDLSSTHNNRWEIHASRILCLRHFCSTTWRAYYR